MMHLSRVPSTRVRPDMVKAIGEGEQVRVTGVSRRSFMLAALAALWVGAPDAPAQGMPRVVVYKNAACGCCGEWVRHMRANGFRVETQEVDDVTPVRRGSGVPDALASCHTALVGGYAIEGHVPAADVWRLLRERPAVRGLAVPGMVVGSPGMEQGTPQPYATIAFDARGTRVFAQH